MTETCREWVEAKANYCHEPAALILWGKLFDPEALGPRCYDHAAKWLGPQNIAASQLDQHAVYDLRPRPSAETGSGYDDEAVGYVATLIADRDAARAEVAALRARVGLARAALVATGYFSTREVDDDIAPRITELWAALADSETAEDWHRCPECPTSGPCACSGVNPKD